MFCSGLHHIAIICSSYEISKKFYTELLGFKILKETYRPERRSYKLDLAVPGGGQLELFSFENRPERPSHPEACGLRHLAFRVKDIEAAMKYLREKKFFVKKCESMNSPKSATPFFKIQMGCRWSFMKSDEKNVIYAVLILFI